MTSTMPVMSEVISMLLTLTCLLLTRRGCSKDDPCDHIMSMRTSARIRCIMQC
jgi:hypothetical protein